MKSPHCFIVKPIGGRRYDNLKKIGGIDFITSSSKEDYTVSNRFAKVIETPLRYSGDIQVGDTLLVHHNAFKFYNDMQGKERSGRSFFKEDLFLIDEDQYFAYSHDGVWKSRDKFCFIKPVPPKKYTIDKAIKEEELIGVLKYGNKFLSSMGVNEGDEVGFVPDSEYEFNIDGEKLYRMYNHAICVKT